MDERMLTGRATAVPVCQPGSIPDPSAICGPVRRAVRMDNALHDRSPEQSLLRAAVPAAIRIAILAAFWMR